MLMILQAQWIVGFVDGSGCFSVSIHKNESMKCKVQVLPEFVVVQHEKNVQILHALKKHFKCGVIRQNHLQQHDQECYRVRSIAHLRDIIVPFFMKHTLKTKKKVDFMKFRKIILCMDEKKHLTLSGLQEIKQILNSMKYCGKSVSEI